MQHIAVAQVHRLALAYVDQRAMLRVRVHTGCSLEHLDFDTEDDFDLLPLQV
jgi:hypothetical protein